MFGENIGESIEEWRQIRAMDRDTANNDDVLNQCKLNIATTSAFHFTGEKQTIWQQQQRKKNTKCLWTDAKTIHSLATLSDTPYLYWVGVPFAF